MTERDPVDLFARTLGDADGARLALWTTATVAGLLLAVWTVRPDAGLPDPLRAAVVALAVVLGGWSAARGRAFLATALLVASPAVGYAAAALLAPLFGVSPVRPDLTAPEAAAGLVGAVAVAALLTHSAGAAVGYAWRRVSAEPTE